MLHSELFHELLQNYIKSELLINPASKQKENSTAVNNFVLIQISYIGWEAFNCFSFPFPTFEASSCTHVVLFMSTSNLEMYSSTSMSTVQVCNLARVLSTCEYYKKCTCALMLNPA